MSNKIVTTTNELDFQLPDFLTHAPTLVPRKEEVNFNNRLSFMGKGFHFSKSNVEQPLKIAKYDEVLETKYIEAVILGSNPTKTKSARIYYREAWDKDKKIPPTCYSADGVTPAQDVKDKQSATCMLCPQNVAGSAPNGRKACSSFKRAVAFFIDDPEQDLYYFDIKSQSLWGPSDIQHNRLNFEKYRDRLAAARNGAGVDMGYIVTRISFDSSESTSKLLFESNRSVNEQQAAKAIAYFESGRVEEALSLKMSTVDTTVGAEQSETPIEPPEISIPVMKEEPKKTKSKPVIEMNLTNQSDIDTLLKELDD